MSFLPLLVAGCSHAPDARAPAVERSGLPLSFEANHGQAPGAARFLARAGHGTLLLGRRGAELRSGSDAIRMWPANGRQSTPVAGERLPGRVNYLVGPRTQWRRNVPTYSDVRFRAVYPGIDLRYHGDQRQLEYDFDVAPGADASAIELAFAGARSLRVDRDGSLVIRGRRSTMRQLAPISYQPATPTQPRTPVASHYELDGRRVRLRVGAYDRTRPLVIDPTLAFATYFGGTGPDAPQDMTTDSAGNSYITGFTQSTALPATAGSAQPNGGLGSDDGFITKIDPTGTTILWTSFIGGSAADDPVAVAVDSGGNPYVYGGTLSLDLPTTAGVLQGSHAVDGGFADGFVAKLNSGGTAYTYLTYLGGNSVDSPAELTVDGTGAAYLTGYTGSTGMGTAGVVQPNPGTPGTSTSYVAKINATATTTDWFTYLGGTVASDFAKSIALDSSNRPVVVGQAGTSDFPVTLDAQQANLSAAPDMFITKLSADATALVYSSYHGGNGADSAYSVAVTGSDSMALTGLTSSTNMPVPGAAQANNGGGSQDAYTAVFAPTGAVTWATYFGGNGYEVSRSLVIDPSGNIWTAGATQSANLPTVNPVQATLSGQDATIAEYSPTGTLLFASYLGGTNIEDAYGIGVDANGNAYFGGQTQSTDFPATAGAAQTNAAGGGTEAFLARITPDPPPSGGGGSGGGSAPPPDAGPAPTTSPPAAPAAALPPPVFASTVDATPVSGTVLVQLPNTTKFVPIERAGQVLPVGTVVDARRGRVRLTASLGRGKGIGVADFFEGVFKITQKSSGKGVTELTLVGGSFNGCPGPGGKGAQVSARLKKTKSIRHLWGDGKGLFRTKGRYAAASLRGTKWLTDDRCDGTLIRVASGAVNVTDIPRKKTILLKAPKKYLAKAR